MSPDEKAKMREKETIGRKILRLSKNDIPIIISLESKERARLQKMKSRLGMSHGEKAKMREKVKNTMNRLKDSMSPDEKAKMKEKEINERKILRDGMSPDEKATTREKETNAWKRWGMASPLMKK